MNVEFIYDSRLDLSLPHINVRWTELEQDTQEHILSKWETIRGTIPDRVKTIEQEINMVHAALTEEENFERSCELNLKWPSLHQLLMTYGSGFALIHPFLEWNVNKAEKCSFTNKRNQLFR